MAQDHAFRSQGFIEICGKFAGYVRKIDMGKLSGEVVENNLGGSNRIKKHVVKMKHDPISFEVGVGMGFEIYNWMKSSFKNQHLTQDGAIMIVNTNFDVVRRMDFTAAHITEITLPALDAKGKDALYFTVKMQPTTTRHSAGGGKANVVIGAKQKSYGATNFRMLSPLGDTKALISIDATKWTQTVQAVEYGEFIEATHAPTKTTVGDLKFTLSSHAYAEWEKKAHSWFVAGARSEAMEVTNVVQILDTDAQKIIAELSYENCGLKEFKFSDLDANADKLNTFDVTCYCEYVDIKINEYD